MPLGLTVARDAFQHKLDTVLSNYVFYTGIVDDMIMWGEQPDGGDPSKTSYRSLAAHKKAQSKTKI